MSPSDTTVAEKPQARSLETDALKTFAARLTGHGGPFEITRQADGRPRFAGGPDNLGDVFRRAAKYGDRPLLKIDDRSHSYAEIFAAAENIRARIQTSGWAGHRIALQLPDGAEWASWFVAVTAAGATCVLVPYGAVPDSYLAQADCAAVVSPEREVGPRPNLYFNLPEDIAAAAAIDPDSDALIAFSSGSTGAPKGIIHTHRSLLTAQRNMLLAGMVSAQMRPVRQAPERAATLPVTLLMTPLSYVAGYSALLLAMATGGCLLLAQAEANIVADQIEQQTVQTIVGASVDVFRQLARLPGASNRLRSLRRLHVFGAAVQQALVDEIAAVLPDLQLTTGYGLSETGGAIAAAPVAVVTDHPGLSGRCLPTAEVRAIAADGTVCPAGETGHLQVRGDMVMRAYLDPRLTGARLSPDGWFDTGDIGYVDSDGWLTIRDRAEGQLEGLPTALFRSEIEALARARLGVDDIAVEWSGGVLSAYVCGQAPNEARLTTGLRELTGAADVRIVILSALPRTTSGKVDRARLE